VVVGDPVTDAGRDRRRWHGVVLDDECRFRVGEDGGSLVGTRPVVHRGERGPEETHGEQRLEECRVVLAEPGDAVPAGDPQAAKAVRQAADPDGQLRTYRACPWD